MFSKLNINIQKLVFKRKGASAASSTPPPPASLSRCLSIDDFEYLSILGTGTTCSVYLVYSPLSKRQPADIHQERDLLRSISALPDTPKYLLALDASWSDADFYYLLTVNLPLLPFSTAHRRPQPCAPLCLDVIHRDIKPKNIFVAKDGNVVLGDLGFAKVFHTPERGMGDGKSLPLRRIRKPHAARLSSPTMDELYITHDPCGTFDWMSPAQHIGNPYSFGRRCMGSGPRPFGFFHDPWAQVSAFAFDEVNFRPEDTVDPVAQELVRGLRAKKTHKRTTIAQAKSHAYFHGVDWTAAAQHKGPATWAPKEVDVPKEASARPLVVGRAYAAGQRGSPEFVFVKPVKEVAPKIAGVSSWRGKSAGTKKQTERTAGAEAQSSVKYDLDSGVLRGLVGGACRGEGRKSTFPAPALEAMDQIL
ncbi:kinase-like domain-containing protein [Mycena olivaceomarginata]|nr:kinase-like domain-containing protein [Mycena olivaceomarginata]